MAVEEKCADQTAVTDFMARPESHGLSHSPSSGTPVQRIDTHGAILFLAGERVYKIKRAVRFPYMDFSTLDLRRHACEREVSLNSRPGSVNLRAKHQTSQPGLSAVNHSGIAQRRDLLGAETGLGKYFI